MHEKMMSRQMFLLLLHVSAVSSQPSEAAKRQVKCAMCGLMIEHLTAALNQIRAELQLPDAALKQSYPNSGDNVLLRAGIVKTLEKLCGNDTFIATEQLQEACQPFVDEHWEEVVGAMVDGTAGGASDQWCTWRTGCSAKEVSDAIAAITRKKEAAAAIARKREKRAAPAAVGLDEQMPPAPSAKKSRKKAKEKEAVEGRCEMCGLLLTEFATTLKAKRDAMKLSREAAARKARRIDSVQKAQTKRWLKEEYNVELVAALEDKMDGLCDGSALKQSVCDFSDTDGKFNPAALRGDCPGQETLQTATSKKATRKLLAKVDACGERVEARCKDVAIDHTERLFREVLDANVTSPLGVNVCVELLPGCEATRAERFFSVLDGEEEGDAEEKTEL